MLVQVENDTAKREAQRAMETVVRAKLRSRGVRNIGFPSGNRDEIIHAQGEGRLWCAFGDAEDTAVPRRWNAFGVYEHRRHAQLITVEINIPTRSNSASVAGFFAQDPATGATYLMHDGGVGGGKKGVGRSAFLAWADRELIEVARSGKDSRDGVLIGRVDSPDLAGRIWKYVQTVRAFKDAVDRGELATDAMRRRIAEWDSYRRESSGRRRGRRTAEIDYVSWHGDVVHLLRTELEQAKAKGEKVSNSPLIDLFVRSGGVLTEIYEVKTSLTRQALYTAVGQLVTHSAGLAEAKRVLVIPDGAVPPDIGDCLHRLGINVRRFRLTAGRRMKIELLDAPA